MMRATNSIYENATVRNTGATITRAIAYAMISAVIFFALLALCGGKL